MTAMTVAEFLAEFLAYWERFDSRLADRIGNMDVIYILLPLGVVMLFILVIWAVNEGS